MECVFCESKEIDLMAVSTTTREGIHMECMNCGATGPIFPTSEEAAYIWRYVLRCVKAGEAIKAVLKGGAA